MLNPLDHIGLVPITLRSWTRLRSGSHWRDTEEWSVAVEGLVDGCRRYRNDGRWKPALWIIWRIRAKLRVLQTTRKRYQRRLEMACCLEAERQKRCWRADTSEEDREWLRVEIGKLPISQRTVLSRLLEEGSNLRRISIDLHMHNATALGHRNAGIATLRRRAFE